MISSLPMPDKLAVPLPAGAYLAVAPGERVSAGQKLADGDGADVLAPADGRIGGICRRPLAGGAGEADCIVLNETRETPPARVESGATAETLKKAGIVGLGGGGFPAARKWRPNLRLFIANAMESEPLASCDKALLAESGDAAFAAVSYVGGLFAESAVLAVTGGGFSHPIVRTLKADYAAGNERLLIQHLTGTPPPRGLPPADAGVVCFNIGTVLAMDAALREKTPMLGRVITVHDGVRSVNVRAPFGASVGDIRRFVGAPDSDSAPPPEAVVGAATIVLQIGKAAEVFAAAPCIRCGACEPVCPVRLSPLLLHALSRDERWDEMKNNRLPDCLECRRCDEVCPSHIPLTASFAAGKRQLAAQQTEQTRRERWGARHETHLSRKAASRHYLGGDALRRKAAAVITRSSSDAD